MAIQKAFEMELRNLEKEVEDGAEQEDEYESGEDAISHSARQPAGSS